MSKYIEIKPSWEGAAKMCVILLRDKSSLKGKQAAYDEIVKMGQALDKAEKTLEELHESVSKIDPIVGKKTSLN